MVGSWRGHFVALGGEAEGVIEGDVVVGRAVFSDVV